MEALAEELIRKNPEVILVSDEVGYGVVPVDAFSESLPGGCGKNMYEACFLQQKSNQSGLRYRYGDQT